MTSMEVVWFLYVQTFIVKNVSVSVLNMAVYCGIDSAEEVEPDAHGFLVAWLSC